MQNRIWLLALILCVCLLPLQIAHADEAGAAHPEDKGFSLAASSDGWQLLVNEKNLCVRWRNTETGQYWDTKEMSGQSGSKGIKNIEKSDLNISFITNELIGTANTMDNYSLSVKLENYAITYLPNGFEVRYDVGDDTLTIDDLPKMIPVEKYNELLLPNWSSKNDDSFRAQYRYIDGRSYWVRIKDDSLGQMVIKSLYELIFDKGQYTLEDLEADNAAYGYVVTTMNPRIEITVRYELDGGDLKVTIPVSEINEVSENAVSMLELLPYFMTGTTAQTGYMFVPDGSGSLIELNNQKTVAVSYTGRVYGSDVLRYANKYQAATDPITMPVYGIKADDSAVLAIIEKGAEIAEIYADISGRSDEFNRITARFYLRDTENVSLVGNETITSPRYPDDSYRGDIVMRYKMLSGDQACYTGMAHTYRAYLIDAGTLVQLEEDGDMPFFVDLIGAVAKDKFILGIPYTSTVQATTIAQAGEIYQALRDEGISNIQMMFEGLFTNGVKNASLTSLSLDGGMGDWNALSGLQAALKRNGDTLYPRVYLGRVFTDRAFSKVYQAARKLDGEYANVVMFGEPVMKRTRAPYKSYYISPHALPDYLSRAVNNLLSRQMTALAAKDIGGTLTPDYKRGENMSRIHATGIYEQALSDLSAQVSLVLSSPNLYAARYADALTDLPATDNGYKVEDTAIPFVQLVYDGTAVYCGKPWNLTSYNGITDSLLFAIETRSAPYFTFTYQSPEIFHNTQDTDYLAYFSTQYTQWLAECGDIYAACNAFFDLTRGARIVSHDTLEKNVKRVLYDNGVTVYVNYTNADVVIDGVTVPAQQYVTKGGPSA